MGIRPLQWFKRYLALFDPEPDAELLASFSKLDWSAFDELRYPVYCAACGYSLRGLPDSACPECGKPFTRGELLVRQYGSHWQCSPWRFSTAGRWYGRLVRMGAWVQMMSVALMPLVVIVVIIKWRSTGTMPTSIFRMTLFEVNFAGYLTGVILQAIAVFLLIATFPRNLKQRRREVREAMDYPSEFLGDVSSQESEMEYESPAD